MIYDLTLKISEDLPTYFGDPKVTLLNAVTYSDKGYKVTFISMGTHTGTHVDFPVHFLKDAPSLEDIQLDRLIGIANFVEIIKAKNEIITIEDLKKIDICPDEILIIRTGWEKNKYKNNYFDNYPYFSIEAANYLSTIGIKSIGSDIPSFDGDHNYGQVHRKILGSNILIIEALINLKNLIGKKIFFSALPLYIANGDGSPVRAIAFDKI